MALEKIVQRSFPCHFVTHVLNLLCYPCIEPEPEHLSERDGYYGLYGCVEDFCVFGSGDVDGWALVGRAHAVSLRFCCLLRG